MTVSPVYRKFMLAATALLMLASSCQRTERPPVGAAHQALVNHFNLPAYRGLVEVVEVNYADHFFDELGGSEFVDVMLEADILVKEGHVVSRIFTFGAFEVDPSWPAIRKSRIEQAPDEESRQAVRDLYERRTFSEGKHSIVAMITLTRIANQWAFLNLMLDSPDDSAPGFSDDFKEI